MYYTHRYKPDNRTRFTELSPPAGYDGVGLCTWLPKCNGESLAHGFWTEIMWGDLRHLPTVYQGKTMCEAWWFTDFFARIVCEAFMCCPRFSRQNRMRHWIHHKHYVIFNSHYYEHITQIYVYLLSCVYWCHHICLIINNHVNVLLAKEANLNRLKSRQYHSNHTSYNHIDLPIHLNKHSWTIFTL